jgi:hypothetical protein
MDLMLNLSNSLKETAAQLATKGNQGVEMNTAIQLHLSIERCKIVNFI